MRIIGLTGGIASGKSAAASLLEKKGARLIDADVLAREVVLPGQPAYQDIVEAFGPEILKPDHTLDRARLGARVFGDEAARKKLNAATHPRIRALMLERLAAAKRETPPPPAIVLVIPLLFENRLEGLVNEVWLVSLAPEAQRARLMARDGLSAAEAERRIAAQLPLEEKKARAQRILVNDGTLRDLAAEVERAWREADLQTP